LVERRREVLGCNGADGHDLVRTQHRRAVRQ
jgi:hypothetical protein